MDDKRPLSPTPMELGLVHVYTGHGKGKTTASLGLALRAIGQGFKACMIQFLKGGKYTGEYITARTNLEGLDIYQFGKECIKMDTQLKLDGFSKNTGQKGKNNGNMMVRGVSFCGDCRACFTIGETERQDTLKGLAFAKKTVASGDYDVIILDEICSAINQGLIDADEIVELAKSRPPGTELIFTGRDAPRKLLDIADYVSNIESVRHPYDKGIEARRGIEY